MAAIRLTFENGNQCWIRREKQSLHLRQHHTLDPDQLQGLLRHQNVLLDLVDAMDLYLRLLQHPEPVPAPVPAPAPAPGPVPAACQLDLLEDLDQLQPPISHEVNT